MARRASDLLKTGFAVASGSFDFGIFGTHTARDGQGGLINGNSRDVSAGQFVDKAVTVFINSDTKAFLGLHAMVMREGVIGELPQRNGSAGLVERHEYQTGRMGCFHRSEARRRQTLDAGCIPRAIDAASERAKQHAFAGQCASRPGRDGVSDRLEVAGHLASEHFDEAGAIHSDGFAFVGDGLQRDELAALVSRAFGGERFVVIEAGEIKTLTENEYFRGAVAAAPDEWLIVATSAGVRVRPGDAIEVTREYERLRGIGKLRPGRQPFDVSATLAFLDRPLRDEKFFAELDELGDRKFEFFAILKVAGDGDFLSDQ